jgi:GNAT superfamily N-acetyltransferase
MQKTFSAPVVVCRPALPGDRQDVLEFTKFIWEGHDYIKYVWDEWLADPQGILAVAQYGGHAVGLGKLTLISPGQWWLEGLRVDPKYQGLKIGSHIHEYLDKWWNEQGGGAVRLMTSSERVQVHHLCERMGYEKLGEVKSYRAPAEGPEASHSFEPVRPEDAKEAAGYATARLADLNGLMDSGWQFSEPDEEVLQEKAEQGRLWWWKRGDARWQGLLAGWEDEDDGERVMGIGFAAMPAEALKDLLDDARGLAHELGFQRVLWMAPNKPWAEDALREAGYTSEWDGSAFLYGKKR